MKLLEGERNACAAGNVASTTTNTARSISKIVTASIFFFFSFLDVIQVLTASEALSARNSAEALLLPAP
jgi:hypothetical protein